MRFIRPPPLTSSAQASFHQSRPTLSSREPAHFAIVGDALCQRVPGLCRGSWALQNTVGQKRAVGRPAGRPQLGTAARPAPPSLVAPAAYQVAPAGGGVVVTGGTVVVFAAVGPRVRAHAHTAQRGMR
jgi:hypothetical protein